MSERELKVGDRVQYGNGPCQRYHGLFGTIVGLSPDSWLLVDFDEVDGNCPGLGIKCTDLSLRKVENKKPEAFGETSVRLELTDGFYMRVNLGNTKVGDRRFELSLVGANIMVEDQKNRRYVMVHVTDAIKAVCQKLIELESAGT
jgi:hypothetical protein